MTRAAHRRTAAGPRSAAARAARALAAGCLALCLGACGGEPDRPRMLLVILDTVRADAAGPSYGDPLWQGQTPHLDRLAAEGTVFENAWSAAPWTVPSHASLFTGLVPIQHGCTGASPRLREDLPTLAGLLAGSGYATAAFYSNPWLADRTTGLLRGFSERSEAPIGGLGELTSSDGDQGGRRTLQNLERWLDGARDAKPWFLFVNLLEGHLPYDPAPEIRRERLADLPPAAQVPIPLAHEFNAGRLSASEIDWRTVRRLYGGDVSTADALLGQLIGELEERGLYERTILIVTSDHGENLGEHGLMDHQLSVHETLLHVPLIVRDPTGRVERGRRDDPVMLTDLFATLLSLAGVDRAPARPHARDLTAPASPADARRPLLADYAGANRSLLSHLRSLNPEIDAARLGRALRTVRVGDLRLTAASDGAIWLHDLRSDPRQLVNLADERPEAVEELARLLPGAGVAGEGPGVPASGTAPAETPIDSTTRRQLESLGYIR